MFGGEVGRGWLENNITASLAFAFARVAHPHPSSVSPTKSITRNDSLLYRRLYILFLCFHVRQKHSEKKLLEAAAERRIKRKESNNTSIQSIVIAVGGQLEVSWIASEQFASIATYSLLSEQQKWDFPWARDEENVWLKNMKWREKVVQI